MLVTFVFKRYTFGLLDSRNILLCTVVEVELFQIRSCVVKQQLDRILEFLSVFWREKLKNVEIKMVYYYYKKSKLPKNGHL